VGLLDLPAPLFAWVDAAFAELVPAALRLPVWALFAAAISMGLYLVLSPQRQIAQAKADALAARAALDRFDGEFGDASPLIRAVLGTACRQIGLITWPAILSSLPVLALLVWLSNAYGHTFPANDADVTIRTVPQGLEAHLEAASAPMASSAPSQHQIVVTDRTGRIVDRILWQAPVPTIHKLGNPAGYLPDNSPLERLELELAPQHYLPVGPEWLKPWYVPFFGVLLVASLGIKVFARIE
jgi:hypothetical protein